MTMSRRNASVTDEIASIAANMDKDGMIEFIKRYNHREDALVEIEDCAIMLATKKNPTHDRSALFLIDYLVEKNNSKWNIAGRIFGYANRTDKLTGILRMGGVLGAIFGYAYLGNAGFLEDVLLAEKLHSPNNLEEAEKGLDEGGHLKDKNKLLKLLTHIKEKELREIILQLPAVNTNVVTDTTELLEMAAELRGYMISYRLTYDQAHQFHPVMKKIDEEYPVSFPALILTDIDRRRDEIEYALKQVREAANPRSNSNLTL